MHKRNYLLIAVLTASLALVPAVVRGEGEGGLGDYSPADPICHWPIFPIYSSPGEGCYMSGEYVMYRQKVPLKHQIIAFEGLIDRDGSISGTVDQIVGSRRPVMYADDASGPGTYQPGFKISGGYRWRDGTTLDVSWMNLLKAEYQSTATQVRPLGNNGQFLQNTFLTAPVWNFPPIFAGPPDDTGRGNPGATFGIWNAADEMNISFTQRTNQIDATLRIPVHETENWRCYGLVGPRFFWVWERFWWRTVDRSVAGFADGFDQAIYTNIVSNRMYGAHIGWGNECWLGNGFAASLDLGAALFVNVVKERAKYELGVKNVMSNKRAITEYTVVPELTATANVFWYPLEGIQLRLGYNVMAFFNTIAAGDPVDFDYGRLTPAWEKYHRWFDGFQVGAAVIF